MKIKVKSKIKISSLFSGKISLFIFLAGILFLAANCTANQSASVGLPRDILGISLNQDKESAAARLNEIAVFERDDRRQQEVWKLKDNPRFSHLLVGFDSEKKLRYVTAVAKEKGGTKMRYDEVGDTKTAKQEMPDPNRRYIWLIEGKAGETARTVIAQGNNPEFLSTYSITKTPGGNAADEKDEEEKEEK